MTRTLPTTTPMAALRTMRKGAWWSVLHADLHDASSTLAGPMADLSTGWAALQSALGSYGREPDAESWDRLRDALVAFDGALALFLGPSGWETPLP